MTTNFLNMKFKIIIVCILFVSCTFPTLAQSWESVKASREFLWGEGRGSSVAEADQEALRDLISKISVHVSGDFKIEEEETTINGKLDARSTVKNVVNTYSQATLTNTERLIIENEPDAHVGRWIKRSEINRIFESRKAKVLDLVNSALRAETSGKVDFALKDYYWALTLLKSLQHPNEVVFTDENDGRKHLLMTWIPERMNLVFDDLSVNVVSRHGDDVDLQFCYRDKPVGSLDYTYFDGQDWSNIYSAKDGQGVLELAPGNVSSNYQLKIEYEYRGEAHIDKELESVLHVVKSTPMRKAYLNVASDAKKPSVTNAISTNAVATKQTNSGDYISQKSFSQISTQAYRMPQEMKECAPYEQVMNRVMTAIGQHDYESVIDCFTPQGLDIYKRLIQYGTARILGDVHLAFYESGNEVYCRGAKMSFSFKSGMRKSFVENVCFMLNREGKIDNVTFGLGQTTVDDILGKGVWSEKSRMAIMQFLENYQTAYALKRLDYIETIFDDDAVIITGTVVKRAAGQMDDNGNMALTNKIVRYNRFDKRSYLKHLAQSFASKEFINVRFANNDVRKLGTGNEVYAIQISQEYYSSNYGDKGYLFLIVDINDPDHPIIKVRTWQPDKDPEFGLYGPEHFF